MRVRAACCVLFAVSALGLAAAQTSSDAIAVLLNSKNSVSARAYQTALDRVSEEAAQGKPLQQFVIGVTTADKDLSARYLEASREKIRTLAEKTNNPLAWYLLSMEKNDFACLQRAADGGNVQALNALGTIALAEAMTRKGISKAQMKEIESQCYGYFHKAALMRDANALVNLGTCYQRGIGCTADLVLAFRCFKTAADLGHPEATDYVSACYQFGHGVEKDDATSLFWAMRGRAMRGDEAAAKWLKERK